MPTYEYKCSDCTHTFDVFQKMSDDRLTECKKCGGNRSKVKELQVDRGDEPTNIFITCLDCGHVEKQ